METDRSQIMRYLCMENAKRLAFLFVVVVICYHGFYHLSGRDSCEWMLANGRKEENFWQPTGCMLHRYSIEESRQCLKYIPYWNGRNQLVFVGDSRIRELFLNFIKMVNNSADVHPGHHEDIHFYDEELNTKIDFYWKAYLGIDYIKLLELWLAKPVDQRPNVIVTGSATWTIKEFHASPLAFQMYRSNLSSVVPYLERFRNTTQVLWMLQDPVEEWKLKEVRKMITNEQVNLYNEAAMQILMKSAVGVWTSSRAVGESYLNTTDGLHTGHQALHIDSQMLLNMYCNSHMQPPDGSCCRVPERVGNVQILAAGFFIACILVSLVIYIVKWYRDYRQSKLGPPLPFQSTNQQPEEEEPIVTFMTVCGKMGLIMAYFYLCDRGDFFLKENKHYSHLKFAFGLIYTLVPGFIFTAIPSQFTKEHLDNPASKKQPQFLHRHQSDEWKGWLQLLILVYHMTGASRVLPIYMHVRVLVSSYLFLSGYGHFCYFYNKGDFSFIRLCKVMFRMNIQVALLCCVMNRPYQFYYFVPLVSFWFLVVYMTMATWPHVTAAAVREDPMKNFYMVLKLIILGVVIQVLFTFPVLFEKIFLAPVVKGLFMLSDHTVKEWRFRWSLDRYSTLSGIAFGFLVQTARHYHLFDDSNHGNCFSIKSILTMLLSVCGLLGYTFFTLFCDSKVECNSIHSCILFIPIISYLLLRNIPGWLRVRHSMYFAWFGQISLELFISQYHIWLAADTQGLLVLIPGFPLLNLHLTTFIFVCVAHEICQLNIRLDALLVPATVAPLVRNVSIFAAALLLLATSHGMLGV